MPEKDVFLDKYREVRSRDPHNRRKEERRAVVIDGVNNSIDVRELEIVFEHVMELNRSYETHYDSYIQPQLISSLQDLEDFVGTMYNNYNANVEVKNA